jgi:acetyl esterase/lipase
MAINPAMRLALKALSYPDLDTKRTYKLQRQMEVASHPYLKPLFKMWDHRVSLGDHDIPVRIFRPENTKRGMDPVFFHGGGWVLGNIDSYTTVCAYMAKRTGHMVVSVDYRLAPEFPFPAASEDAMPSPRKSSPSPASWTWRAKTSR